jgi:hypothetical protein
MKNGRIVNSWKFPEGLFMKAIATRLYDKGLRGDALVEEFVGIIPHWASYFEKPISPNAIAQRADKARRYENESPEKNPAIKVYWPAAGRVAREGKRLSRKAISQIVSKVKNKETAERVNRKSKLTNGRSRS